MMNKKNGIVVLKKGAYGGYITNITSKNDFEEGKVYDAIYYNNHIKVKDVKEDSIIVKVRKCKVECKKNNGRYAVFDISSIEGEEQIITIRGKFMTDYKRSIDQISFFDKYGVTLQGEVRCDFKDRGIVAYADVEEDAVWQGILRNKSLNGEFIILQGEQKGGERKITFTIRTKEDIDRAIEELMKLREAM